MPMTSTCRAKRGAVLVVQIVLWGYVSACAAPLDRDLAWQASAIIYGEDDRVDTYAVHDDALRELAESSMVALFSESALNHRPDGTIEITAGALGDVYHLCPSESFRQQPAAARCSGVLMDDTLVLTAGHCANKIAACADQHWVFNYFMSASEAPVVVQEVDDYRCKSTPLATKRVDPDGRIWDFGWVELDRPVLPPRRPPRVSSGRLAKDARLSVMGFPNGLPLKVDPNARAYDARECSRDYFTMASDTFDANSGSGVFDEDYGLAGVFVRGGYDFVYREEENCFASRRLIAPDSKNAEQASYVRPAIAALCASGWPCSAAMLEAANALAEPHAGCPISPTEPPHLVGAACAQSGPPQTSLPCSPWMAGGACAVLSRAARRRRRS